MKKISDQDKKILKITSEYVKTKIEGLEQSLDELLEQKSATLIKSLKYDIKGESGERGDRGDRGEHGDRGERGEEGRQGFPGVQGFQGPKGEVGDKITEKYVNISTNDELANEFHETVTNFGKKFEDVWVKGVKQQKEVTDSLKESAETANALKVGFENQKNIAEEKLEESVENLHTRLNGNFQEVSEKLSESTEKVNEKIEENSDKVDEFINEHENKVALSTVQLGEKVQEVKERFLEQSENFEERIDKKIAVFDTSLDNHLDRSNDNLLHAKKLNENSSGELDEIKKLHSTTVQFCEEQINRVDAYVEDTENIVKSLIESYKKSYDIQENANEDIKASVQENARKILDNKHEQGKKLDEIDNSHQELVIALSEYKESNKQLLEENESGFSAQLNELADQITGKLPAEELDTLLKPLASKKEIEELKKKIAALGTRFALASGSGGGGGASLQSIGNGTPIALSTASVGGSHRVKSIKTIPENALSQDSGNTTLTIDVLKVLGNTNLTELRDVDTTNILDKLRVGGSLPDSNFADSTNNIIRVNFDSDGNTTSISYVNNELSILNDISANGILNRINAIDPTAPITKNSLIQLRAGANGNVIPSIVDVETVGRLTLTSLNDVNNSVILDNLNTANTKFFAGNTNHIISVDFDAEGNTTTTFVNNNLTVLNDVYPGKFLDELNKNPINNSTTENTVITLTSDADGNVSAVYLPNKFTSLDDIGVGKTLDIINNDTIIPNIAFTNNFLLLSNSSTGVLSAEYVESRLANLLDVDANNIIDSLNTLGLQLPKETDGSLSDNNEFPSIVRFNIDNGNVVASFIADREINSLVDLSDIDANNVLDVLRKTDTFPNKFTAANTNHVINVKFNDDSNTSSITYEDHILNNLNDVSANTILDVINTADTDSRKGTSNNILQVVLGASGNVTQVLYADNTLTNLSNVNPGSALDVINRELIGNSQDEGINQIAKWTIGSQGQLNDVEFEDNILTNLRDVNLRKVLDRLNADISGEKGNFGRAIRLDFTDPTSAADTEVQGIAYIDPTLVRSISDVNVGTILESLRAETITSAKQTTERNDYIITVNTGAGNNEATIEYVNNTIDQLNDISSAGLLSRINSEISLSEFLADGMTPNPNYNLVANNLITLTIDDGVVIPSIVDVETVGRLTLTSLNDVNNSVILDNLNTANTKFFAGNTNHIISVDFDAEGNTTTTFVNNNLTVLNDVSANGILNRLNAIDPDSEITANTLIQLTADAQGNVTPELVDVATVGKLTLTALNDVNNSVILDNLNTANTKFFAGNTNHIISVDFDAEGNTTTTFVNNNLTVLNDVYPGKFLDELNSGNVVSKVVAADSNNIVKFTSDGANVAITYEEHNLPTLNDIDSRELLNELNSGNTIPLTTTNNIIKLTSDGTSVAATYEEHNLLTINNIDPGKVLDKVNELNPVGEVGGNKRIRYDIENDVLTASFANNSLSQIDDVLPNKILERLNDRSIESGFRGRGNHIIRVDFTAEEGEIDIISINYANNTLSNLNDIDFANSPNNVLDKINKEGRTPNSLVNGNTNSYIKLSFLNDSLNTTFEDHNLLSLEGVLSTGILSFLNEDSGNSLLPTIASGDPAQTNRFIALDIDTNGVIASRLVSNTDIGGALNLTGLNDVNNSVILDNLNTANTKFFSGNTNHIISVDFDAGGNTTTTFVNNNLTVLNDVSANKFLDSINKVKLVDGSDPVGEKNHVLKFDSTDGNIVANLVQRSEQLTDLQDVDENGILDELNQISNTNSSFFKTGVVNDANTYFLTYGIDTANNLTSVSSNTIGDFFVQTPISDDSYTSTDGNSIYTALGSTNSAATSARWVILERNINTGNITKYRSSNFTFPNAIDAFIQLRTTNSL